MREGNWDEGVGSEVDGVSIMLCKEREVKAARQCATISGYQHQCHLTISDRIGILRMLRA